jgi:hypothetical protein
MAYFVAQDFNPGKWNQIGIIGVPQAWCIIVIEHIQ